MASRPNPSVQPPAARTQTPPRPTLPFNLQIRDDLDVPVLLYNSESDVVLSSARVRQPDTNRFRLWESAGTSHSDQYLITYGLRDDGRNPAAIDDFVAALLRPTKDKNGRGTCDAPLSGGPDVWVLSAALHHLQAWVADKKLPPVAPRVDVASMDPLKNRVDDNGNTLGAVRTPYVDVPVAKLDPVGVGPGLCSRGGAADDTED